jgi:hypothetical protein
MAKKQTDREKLLANTALAADGQKVLTDKDVYKLMLGGAPTHATVIKAKNPKNKATAESGAED